MASSSTTTDLALRSALNSKPSEQERLACAILSLDPQYKGIKTRQPEGGSDGGWDIEAVLADGTIVYGAVGFKNNANDDTKQRREIAKKFKGDLAKSLKARPDLRGFVFVTNVNLTVGVAGKLEAEAKNAGIRHVDIYDRDRLCSALNSTKGLAYRLQYLDISMSDEEQKCFFMELIDDRQNVLRRQHSEVSSTLEHIEFRNAMTRPLRDLRLRFAFGRHTPASDLVDAAAVVKLMTLPEDDRGWLIGGAADFSDANKGISTTTLHRLQDSTTPMEEVFHGVKVYAPYLFGMDFSVRIQQHNPPITPEFLEHRCCRLFITRSLASCAESATLEINGYQVARFLLSNLRETTPRIPWPSRHHDWLQAAEWLEHDYFTPTIDLTNPLAKSSS